MKESFQGILSGELFRVVFLKSPNPKPFHNCIIRVTKIVFYLNSAALAGIII